MLSLSSIDGSPDGASPKISFGPSDVPEPMLPASIGPAAPRRTPMPGVPVQAQPLDLFTPPAAIADLAVDLAPDELEYRERRGPVSTPPAGYPPQDMSTSASLPRPNTPVLQRRPAPATRSHVNATVVREPPRWRFAAGVVVAIVLGFVPAHVVASMREDRYAQLDKELIAVQTNATSAEDHEKLDAVRAKTLERKRTERRTIALVALGIWAAAAAAIAFVWFRLIPWR